MRADLTTKYLGLQLRNPIVASAGPLTGNLDTLRELEAHGVAAAVLPSLFEEQICYDEQRIHALYEFQAHTSAESLSYFPKLRDYNVGPHEYLELLEKAKKAVSIPVIASLNGSTPECRICPPLGRSRQTTARPSVDFPEPDSPITPKVSPGLTSKLTSTTALTLMLRRRPVNVTSR